MSTMVLPQASIYRSRAARQGSIGSSRLPSWVGSSAILRLLSARYTRDSQEDTPPGVLYRPAGILGDWHALNSTTVSAWRRQTTGKQCSETTFALRSQRAPRAGTYRRSLPLGQLPRPDRKSVV